MRIQQELGVHPVIDLGAWAAGQVAVSESRRALSINAPGCGDEVIKAIALAIVDDTIHIADVIDVMQGV